MRLKLGEGLSRNTSEAPFYISLPRLLSVNRRPIGTLSGRPTEVTIGESRQVAALCNGQNALGLVSEEPGGAMPQYTAGGVWNWRFETLDAVITQTFIFLGSAKEKKETTVIGGTPVPSHIRYRQTPVWDVGEQRLVTAIEHRGNARLTPAEEALREVYYAL